MTKENFLIFMWEKYKKDKHLSNVVRELKEKGYNESDIEGLYDESRSRDWIIPMSNCDKITCPFKFTEEGKKKAIEIQDELNKNWALKFNDWLSKYNRATCKFNHSPKAV